MDRFKSLVDSKEGIESFRALYRIPPGVGIRYCKEGQWHEDRQEGEVVIPMIAFIEGGMKILIGGVTRDYLRAHRLAPTQCVPNMFRILGFVDALNKKMGLGLTHHDVNWVYNLHHLKGQGYYLKSRYPEVRLIQCLPESNKGLNKDFLIVSREWHDGLPCPTRKGQPGRVLGLGRLYKLTRSLLPIWFLILAALCFFDGFADKHAAEPNLNLVNKDSLDKILRVEVFVNTDGQLRAAHLILGY